MAALTPQEEEEFEFQLMLEKERAQAAPPPTKFDEVDYKDAAIRGGLDLPMLPLTGLEMAGAEWPTAVKDWVYGKAGIPVKEPNLRPEDKVPYEAVRGATGGLLTAPWLPFNFTSKLLTAGARTLFGAASGAAGGAASETAGQAVEAAGGTPTQAMLARLGAGVATGMVAEGGMFNTIKEGALTAVENSITGGTKGQIARHTLAEVGGVDNVKETLRALDRERELFGEMYRPLADAVFPDAVTLSKAKSSRLATAPLSKQAKAIEQMKNTVKAVEHKTNYLFGEAGESGMDALTLARQRYGDDSVAVAAGIAKNDLELEHFTDTLSAKEAGSFDNIRKLHNILLERQVKNRAAFDMQYNKLIDDAEKAGVTWKPDAILNTIDATTLKRRYQNVPGVENAIEALQQLQDAAAAGPVPFRLLKEASDRINDGFYRTKNDPNMTQAHGIYGQLKKALSQAKTTVTDPAVSAKWDNINLKYDEIYRETFQKGLGLHIKKGMEANTTEFLETKLISQDGARHFKKVFGAGVASGDNKHIEYLTEIAWAKFLKGEGAIVNGVISNKAIDRYLAKNADFFSEFDNFGNTRVNPIREAFQTKADTLRGILARKDALMETKKTLESSSLHKLTNFNNFTDAVKEATKNNEVLGTLWEVSKNNPDVQRGVKRELMSQLMAQKERAEEWFLQHRHVFRAVMDKDEYENARTISSGWTRATRQFLPPPHAKTVEKSELEQTFGQDWATLIATYRRPIISFVQKNVIAASRIIDRRRAVRIEDDVIDLLTDPRQLAEVAAAARRNDWGAMGKALRDGLIWSAVRNTARVTAAQQGEPEEYE